VGEKFALENERFDDSRFFYDEEPLDDIFLDGRSLAQDPYSLLIRPKDADVGIFVAVMAYDAEQNPIGFARLPPPTNFVANKVLEWEVTLERIPSGVFVGPTGCLVIFNEEGGPARVARGSDQDCDGYISTDDDGRDCNDLNPFQNPGKVEDCGNGVDDDCNGLVDGEDTEDVDRDSFGACGGNGGDCNDHDATVNPGATETCNGVDNDCDGVCDGGFDADGDGYTTCGSFVDGGECLFLDDSKADCDDTDASNYVGNEEICDGKDNNCNQRCDEESSLDPDQDGFTHCGSFIDECSTTLGPEDCEPENPEVHPGAAEICDGIDQDCDGNPDDKTTPCFAFEPTSGNCAEGIRTCQGGVLADEPCDIDNGSSVDPSLCLAYEACNETDPFACVLAGDEVNVDKEDDCLVGIGAGVQCEGRTVRIEGPDNGQNSDCKFTIIGGSIQQGYQVDLRGGDGTEPPGTTLDACTALLRVTALPGASRAVILINFASEQIQSFLLQINLDTDRGNVCGSRLGLDCNEFPNDATPVPAP
tara:strand:+ start:110313 stop:111908 length:1596 start_codon:yes stop_codon:yes gene_type:complete